MQIVNLNPLAWRIHRNRRKRISRLNMVRLAIPSNLRGAFESAAHDHDVEFERITTPQGNVNGWYDLPMNIDDVTSFLQGFKPFAGISIISEPGR